MSFTANPRRLQWPLRRFTRSRTGSRWVGGLTIMLALGLLVYAGWDGVNRYQTTHSPQIPPPGQVITSSTGYPNETKLDIKQAEYKVAADMPRLISLPTIGAEGFIQQMGVDPKTNAVAVPTNIHLTGWYIRSVKPGEAGVSLIDGHVQGSYMPGIFKNLAKLQSGQTFGIEYGDGSRRTFEVVRTSSYSAADAAGAMLAPIPGISHQLNLITCAGAFDKASRQYEQRLVVVAKLVK